MFCLVTKPILVRLFDSPVEPVQFCVKAGRGASNNVFAPLKTWNRAGVHQSKIVTQQGWMMIVSLMRRKRETFRCGMMRRTCSVE